MNHRCPHFALKLPACSVLMVGLFFSFALFLWICQQEQYEQQVRFERHAQLRAATIREKIQDVIEALQAINQLFVANGNVSREQFHVFAQALRARYPYIATFGFQRRVSKDERRRFEAHRRARFPGFSVGEVIDGKRVTARVKDYYDVIDYIEPMAGNEIAFGIDISSLAVLRDAMRRTESTGLPSATGLYSTFKDRGRQRSLRILMAVYKGGVMPANVAARDPAVIGHTGAMLRTDELIEKILSSLSATIAPADIRVYAASWADESKLVHAQVKTATPDWRDRAIQLLWPAPKAFSENFDLAGTTWHVLVSPQPASFLARQSNALLALMMGLFATCAATAYLQSIIIRRQQIEQLVAERTGELALRTAELSHLNARLLTDIRARKQAEQALIRSERRAHELAELSSDWYWELDQDLRFVCSSAINGKKFGPPAWIKAGLHPWQLTVDLQASDWSAHCATLQAHQAFKGFEVKILVEGMPDEWASISGKPRFDAQGCFLGFYGTGRNISARKAAEQALRHSQSMLRELAGHLELVREDERKRIARDIHDDLGQNLLVLKMDVAALCARTLATHPRLHQRAAGVLSTIQATVTSLKTIMNNLRPASLDQGLYAAVAWQVQQFVRIGAIGCKLVATEQTDFGLNEVQTLAAFRILQESLNNVARHAQATEVEIALSRDAHGFAMRIADNGKGFETGSERKANSFGLVGIKERIHALGGTFTIQSSPDQGTVLTIRIGPQEGSSAG